MLLLIIQQKNGLAFLIEERSGNCEQPRKTNSLCLWSALCMSLFRAMAFKPYLNCQSLTFEVDQVLYASAEVLPTVCACKHEPPHLLVCENDSLHSRKKEILKICNSACV